MAPDKAHSRAAPSEPYPSNDQVRAIHKFDVVVPVPVVGWTSEQRICTFCGANDNRLVRGAIHRDGPPGILRIRPTVQDQLIARFERIGDALELFIRADNRRVDFARDA